ncbi:phage/plasmid primase, P4 family [Actinomadura sp. NPDC049382]|uniref:DNA primase family protein n=1 Tax=Actinomadura sp. NPDC049382 TaxID=3158220 RepID=UPI0034164703
MTTPTNDAEADESWPYPEPHRGQLRMAERLAHRFAGRLLHAHGIGWHYWDGARWALDKDGAATRAVVSIAKAALRELAHLPKGEARNDLFTDIKRIESASGIRGTLEIAGSLRPLSAAADRLDADPFLFNTKTGTLDLRTGEVRPHAPADLITKVAGCGLDLHAHGPVFSKFIAEILPDDEVRRFVQRLFGYALLGQVREHVLPIFTGVGKNGKSTLLDVVSEALGDYAISAEPDLLVDKGGAHPTGQADLLGARLAVCSETDKGRRLAAATVKRLTGGDKVRARRMRQDFFEFDPSHTIIMVTNHKPVVSGDDPAMWRRIFVVPFDVVVETPDPRLPERLALELPAVLAWAFEGYRAYEELGLEAPEKVQQRTDAFRSESDTLGRFLDERTVSSPHAHVRARDLFTEWSQWCHQFGEEAGTEKAFAEAMGLRGLQKKKTAQGMVYRGVGLAANDDSDEA